MRIALALALILIPTVARAERRTIVNVGATFGAKDLLANNVVDDLPSVSLVGPRITLAWENELLPIPALPGHRYGFQIVPELLAGSFVHENFAEGYVGVGLRANLDCSQRGQPGSLQQSVRGGMYAVGRGVVVGGRRNAMYEMGLGYYFARFHTATRVGFETTVIVRPYDHTLRDDGFGAFFGLSVGFGP